MTNTSYSPSPSPGKSNCLNIIKKVDLPLAMQNVRTKMAKLKHEKNSAGLAAVNEQEDEDESDKEEEKKGTLKDIAILSREERVTLDDIYLYFFYFLKGKTFK